MDSRRRVFEKFDRCDLRALYINLRRKWYAPTSSAYEISVVRRRVDILRNVLPRIVPYPSTRAYWIVYTDASPKAEIIDDDAVFQGSTSGFRTVSEAFSATSPEVWKRQFRQTTRIFCFELLAPVAFLWAIRKALSGKRIVICIDNSAALASLIRGVSVSGIAAALVAVFWHIAHEANICIWIARVRSKLIIAHIPTRHVRIICQKKRSFSFRNLLQLLSAS